MGSLWRSQSSDTDQVRRWVAEYGMPERIARVLCTRVASQAELEDVLHPSRIPWTAPDAFAQMDRAVDRLLDAVARGERICVVGDYDADGVTACAILADALRRVGADCVCIIPHRTEDGYGLSPALVDRAAEMGARLLVTVDNGIRCGLAVRHAVGLGLQVIVTDHHQPGEDPPLDAYAVVHWQDATAPALQHLCGAGVAWKLALRLLERSADGPIAAEHYGWWTALAAIGTLADVMPLRGENRRLVREGVAYLKSARQPGWRALCRTAGVDPTALTSDALVWSIIPRINAAGRMDHAQVALALLTATDPAAADAAAAAVEELNQRRRTETERAAAEAVSQVRASHASAPAVVVAAGPWPLGVVGIVAAKLVEQYDCPAIVFADDGSDLLRGSGRSPAGTPLHQWVADCAEWLDHFGGHETALGCGIRRQHLANFREALAARARRERVPGPLMAVDAAGGPGDPVAALTPVADDYLPLADADLAVARWLEALWPYGRGFEPFSFYVGPVQLQAAMVIGGGKHLRWTVREGRQSAQLVWFRPPSWAFDVVPGTSVAVIASLEVNRWRGTETAQLRVHQGWVLAQPLDRAAFAEVYRVLRTRRRARRADLAAALPEQLEPEQLDTVVGAFVELGFAYVAESEYHVVEQAVARDLRESAVYQAHLCARARQPSDAR
ncbi:MAG: single-stranded-DNA-specific exonuclease RecJ [Alicyclobacillus sp.]|nr:single-stranded-DNA-specific exonuclease RecJ [Alicyclobacillus sp.]